MNIEIPKMRLPAFVLAMSLYRHHYATALALVKIVNPITRKHLLLDFKFIQDLEVQAQKELIRISEVDSASFPEPE